MLFLSFPTDAVIIEESIEGRSREGVDKFCNITFIADGNFVIPFTVTVNFMDGSAVGRYLSCIPDFSMCTR